jgi:hypothetical protein
MIENITCSARAQHRERNKKLVLRVSFSFSSTTLSKTFRTKQKTFITDQFYRAAQVFSNGVFTLESVSTSKFLKMKSDSDGTISLAQFKLDGSSDGQKVITVASWFNLATLFVTQSHRQHI